jgi:gluconokinase
VYLLLFFGQSGAGKSFVGRVCAEELGFELHEGDRDLTPRMLAALREQRVFTQEMRREFTEMLSRGIRERWLELAQDGGPRPGLAVCQGLFKARDRARLQLDFPNARLVWVRAPEALIETRLQQRTGHVASNAYARLVNRGFEPPAPDTDVLDNDGDRARVVAQLRERASLAGPQGVAVEREQRPL